MKQELLFALVDQITSNSIEVLELEEYLADKEWDMLTRAILENKSLHTLRISANGRKNELGPRNAILLAKALENHPTIQELDLSHGLIKSEGAIAISELIRTNLNIQALNLNYNKIGPVGLKPLLEALTVNKQINALRVSGNSFGKEDILFPDIKGRVWVYNLANWLKTTDWISHLEYADNKLSYAEAPAFAELMAVNRHIEYYDFSNNVLYNRGVEILSESIATNHAITHVDLSDNSITKKGAIAFAKAISENNSITQILLSDNGIGDKGAKALADAIRKNPNIEAVFLRWEYIDGLISDEGAIALLHSLYEHKSVSTLDLSGNSLSEKTLEAFYELLTRKKEERYRGVVHPLYSRFLKSINLSNTGIRFGFDKMADLLPSLLLENFNFNVNALYTSHGVVTMLEKVLKTPGIRELPRFTNFNSRDAWKNLDPINTLLERVELEINVLEQTLYNYPECPTEAHSVHLALTLNDLLSRIESVYPYLSEYQYAMILADPNVLERDVINELNAQFHKNATTANIFTAEIVSQKQKIIAKTTALCEKLLHYLSKNLSDIHMAVNTLSIKHSAYALLLENWVKDNNTLVPLFDENIVHLIENIAEGTGTETHTRRNLLWGYLYANSQVHTTNMAVQSYMKKLERSFEENLKPF